MSILSVYDINSFIQADADIITLVGGEIPISPTFGYAEEQGPFIVYFYSPSIPNVEAFWNRLDVVVYVIYDTDIVRMLNIGERIIELISKGDQISQPDGTAGTDVRILSTTFRSSAIDGPTERDGWYKMNIEFDIYHVKR